MRTSPRLNHIRDTGNDTRQISETRINKNNQTSRGGPGKKLKAPTQAEIDACTHIKFKKYSRAEYDKFTLAEKAKHYQLKLENGLQPKKRTVAQVETDNDETGETATLAVTNANNPALVRQKDPKTRPRMRHI
jgi:hypothetical protein